MVSMSFDVPRFALTEILRLLRATEVRFIVVGGLAAALTPIKKRRRSRSISASSLLTGRN